MARVVEAQTSRGAARAARRAGYPDYAALIVSYAARYGEPILGRTRAIFDRGDGYVVKIPRDEEGNLANWFEAHYDDPDVPLARCALEMDGDNAVLVMEWVEPVRGPARAELPAWTDWVDCRQVGRTADGRLVAFDL
jgi:hypothetical protein